MAHFRRNKETRVDNALQDANRKNTLDTRMGVSLFEAGPPRLGYLINVKETLIKDNACPQGVAAISCYFWDDEGGTFKINYRYDPYFLLKCSQDTQGAVEEYLTSVYAKKIKATTRIFKEDLKMDDHLIGAKRPVVKVQFHNTTEMNSVRRQIQKHILAKDPIVKDIIDVNEYDVPYYARVLMDNDIRVAKWYSVRCDQGNVFLHEYHGDEEKLAPDMSVMAFDIEATKDPLMFPTAEKDQITMISYMLDGQGYLITNRAFVSKDIDDFSWSPRKEYPGNFHIFNEPNEKRLLERFFGEVRDARPHVIATYNGDSFDWPFIRDRAAVHGMDLFDEIGFYSVAERDISGESKDYFTSTFCSHLDCYRWVKRDSYLPQGSQGLKQVIPAKLGYLPLELDPEDMTPFAKEKPQLLAEYSVSDALGTYYLYMKYVHPFIFALCNIVPLDPDEVLRKGTGTLCEMLLMVEAYRCGIIFPHKYVEEKRKFYDGHLIISETYSGGHVECLESGVFRNDLEYDFKIDTNVIDNLLSQLDIALKYTITKERGVSLDDITNFDEIRDSIAAQLVALKEKPTFAEKPYIYHLDVSSMYPNIMTTNRLQPDSIVEEDHCTKCDFFSHDKGCERKLQWKWRAEYYPLEYAEFRIVENALHQKRYPRYLPQRQKFSNDKNNGNSQAQTISYNELPPDRQHSELIAHVKAYCQQGYHKVKETIEQERTTIICQRENPFYIDTVEAFKKRRIAFKKKAGMAKAELRSIDPSDVVNYDIVAKRAIYNDSMQLAHKVILNSFYGYVKRMGSRWYSAEMAGVTCYTGAKIIQSAREIVSGIGRALELDTDGIWCIIPNSFPADVKFNLKNGKSLGIEYPGVILNYMVYEGFTNPQYHTLVDQDSFTYEASEQNSIFFEVDGPYKAMILPTSLEDGVNLKKRYAVFALDGSLSELKGFELKRRGELEIIKKFQRDLFAKFLKGTSLAESYASAAEHAGAILDLLDGNGANMQDSALLALIAENKSMSKPLRDYGSQKSVAITTAKRIAEFLGEGMVERSGLNACFVICKYPDGAPVTDRAIPVAIFNCETQSTKEYYLRRWLNKPELANFDPRKLIDWAYYRSRLEFNIQKIITIPASLQNIPNPLKNRVTHPDWLIQKEKRKADPLKQQSLTSVFQKVDRQSVLDQLQERSDEPNPSQSSTETQLARKRKDHELENDASVPEPNEKTYSPFENYGAWIQQQKPKWNKLREERENLTKLYGQSAITNTSSMSAMLKLSSLRALAGVWHVLGVVPCSIPGQVNLLVFANELIRKVKVNVPRKLVLELSDDVRDCIPELLTIAEVNPSEKLLPTGSPRSRFLYEVVMDEATFVKESTNDAGVLKHPAVTHVYESRIDPYERFMVEVGNLCSLNVSESASKALTSGVELDQIGSLTATARSKVDYGAFLQRLNILQIQHYEVNNEIFIVLYYTWENKCALLRYSKSLDSMAGLNLVALYRQSYQSIPDSDKDKLFKFDENLHLETETFKDKRKLYEKFSAILFKLHSEQSSKLMVVIQSSSVDRLQREARTLSEIPLVRLQTRPLGLPSVGWGATLAKAIVKSFLRLELRLKECVALAKLSGVPMANIIDGDVKFVIDIMYARRLYQHKHVLWWSPNPLPDLGGNELNTDYLSGAGKPSRPSVINNPGLYANICVEFDVTNFAINSILTANLHGAIDVSNSVELGDENLSLNVFSPQAQTVLSSMLKEWWDLAALENSPVADSLILHFVSWVSSPDSRLFHNSLLHHIETLNEGIFAKLVHVLKALGYQIILASRDRLVVGTTKYFSDNAFDVAKGIVHGIRTLGAKNEMSSLFTYLDTNVREHWDLLVWKDEDNFCGRVLNTESLAASKFRAQLRVADYLPEILKTEFFDFVDEYLQLVAKAKDEHSPSDVKSRLALVQRLKDDENDNSYFARGLYNTLLPGLVARVKQANRHYIECLAQKSSEFDFPKSARRDAREGFDLGTENPVLELVKDICWLLSVDKAMATEYYGLRKRLLDILKVGSFDKRSEFKLPYAELVVANVCCSSCGFVSDINICKAPLNSLVFGWSCRMCCAELSRVYLEERLIQALVGEIHMYQKQDLKCSKCARLRSSDMALYCECSGTFEGTTDMDSLRAKVGLYRRLGTFYELRFLIDALNNLGV